MKQTENILYALGQSSEYIKDYLNSQKNLIKLEFAEHSSKILSKIISRVIALMLVMFAFLFASLTIAIGLSIYLNSFFAGFGIVTASFIILVIVLIVFRNSLITNPVLRLILKDFFN
ncbi:phage holin family protein [Membranihabitans maritimus]|uniref:phage holin family protein n=1 Tax=Membranihabitans maritimus TaxID=2904244 RepID=UPI001F2362A0|nr:phage holin family protein [Membranihabitans maritimus]